MTDAQKDTRQCTGESLLTSLEAALEAMRDSLENDGEETAPDALRNAFGRDCASAEGDGLLAAAILRERVGVDLKELAWLTGYGAHLESPALTGHDLEALQAFRRAAHRDREALERGFSALVAADWRSASDVERSKARRRLAQRWGICLLAAAVGLAGVFGWQQKRQAALLTKMNSAKAQTARQALILLSQAAWQAMRFQNLPLAAIAPDMTANCAGLDVRATLPNHPCREAWATGRQAIFRASIPAPGKGIDAPSEIFFDPWGGPYVVESAANPPAVRSAGPDGRLDTSDDVVAPVPYWRGLDGN